MSPAPGYRDTKQAHLTRLRRVEGQVRGLHRMVEEDTRARDTDGHTAAKVRGLHRMVEEDTYCIDVLTQVSAATKALQAVALGLLEEHMRHCVADAVAQGGAEADAKIVEASAAIARLVKS